MPILSRKYAVPYRTVRSRAIKERWADQKLTSHDAAASTALQIIQGNGRQLAASAAKLVNRTILQTERWLDRIDKQADLKSNANPDDLATLIQAWRTVIGVGRQAHFLDEPASGPPKPPMGSLTHMRDDPGDAPIIDVPDTPLDRPVEPTTPNVHAVPVDVPTTQPPE